MRKPIKTTSSRFKVIDYGKTNHSYLAEQKKEIDFCYFPVEPFGGNLVTEEAVKICISNNIPLSIETRREVPDWAIEALSRNKYSEIRISLNTLDEKKWGLLFPQASKPSALIESFVRSFNGGAFTILKIAPIVPVIIEPSDVFRVVDLFKNWTEQIEVCFASFTEEEIRLLEAKFPESYLEISHYYKPIGNRFYVHESYRQDFFRKLKAFTDGWKLKLKLLNEIVPTSEGAMIMEV